MLSATYKFIIFLRKYFFLGLTAHVTVLVSIANIYKLIMSAENVPDWLRKKALRNAVSFEDGIRNWYSSQMVLFQVKRFFVLGLRVI